MLFSGSSCSESAHYFPPNVRAAAVQKYRAWPGVIVRVCLLKTVAPGRRGVRGSPAALDVGVVVKK